jgi:ribosomal protein S18 acetylase RimI-like enzyme
MTRQTAALRLAIEPAQLTDLEYLVAANLGIALETEQRELDRATLTAGVAAALANPQRGRYFMARTGPQATPVGTLMLTQEWSDWRNGEFWWIQSVYVSPAARGQGVFRALYATVLEAAQQTPGVCGLRLYVDHDNHPARNTYLKVGMKEAGYSVFETDFSAVAR